MRIMNAFVASHAEVHNGLVYAMGAMPEWWSVPATPVVMSLTVVASALLDEEDFDRPHQIRLHLVRPGRDLMEPEPLGYVEFTRSRLNRPEQGVARESFTFNLAMEFREIGLHTFRLTTRTGTEAEEQQSGLTIVSAVDLLVRPTQSSGPLVQHRFT